MNEKRLGMSRYTNVVCWTCPGRTLKCVGKGHVVTAHDTEMGENVTFQAKPTKRADCELCGGTGEYEGKVRNAYNADAWDDVPLVCVCVQ